jgi:MAP/microtubule affinity-regulating kinase
MVTELCGHNNLSRYLKKSALGRLSDSEACYIFKKVCVGVQYLHNQHLCHRDLKLTNILIDRKYRVKIVDFGFAVETQKIHSMYCGTPSYMAPEIVNKLHYRGKPVDIWALGVVLYKLLTGEYPFGCKFFFDR